MRQIFTPRKLASFFILTAVLSLFCSLFGPSIPAAEASSANDCNDPRVTLPSYSSTVSDYLLVSNTEDAIFYSERNDMPYNQIRIVLQTSREVTWWKGVEALYPYTGIVASTSTQDWNHGPNSTVITLNNYTPSLMSIKLLKAKLFGIHTGMYCIDNLSRKRGKTLYFNWVWDDSFPRTIGHTVQY